MRINHKIRCCAGEALWREMKFKGTPEGRLQGSAEYNFVTLVTEAWNHINSFHSMANP
jgi:hypothetical protein